MTRTSKGWWTALLAAGLLVGWSGCGSGTVPADAPEGDASLDATIDDAATDAASAGDAATEAGPDALPPCDGCLDATGRCRAGDEEAACGSGGGSCLRCGDGERCRAGACIAAPPCGPGSCDGCCTEDGRCLGGDSPLACGVGGASCTACADGIPCVEGDCDASAVPCATSCTGCCTEDGTCLDGTDAAACGSAGARCQACGPAAACTMGACELDGASRWDVTALEATVPPMDPSGEDWDPGFGAIRRPDVALKASVFLDGMAIEGEVGPVGDSFEPRWNEVILQNLPPEALLGRDGIGFALRDVDPAFNPDDPIGSCVYAPQPEDFDARRIEMACGEGVTLAFRIEPH